MAVKNSLTFHFQKDSSKAGKDDVLTVRPYAADDGWVSLIYRDREANVKNVCYMKEGGFMLYMENLLKSMKFDDAPYQFVQVTAPLHPSLLLKVSDLADDECLETVGQILSSCWRIWYPFTAKTADEDEDEEEYEHEEDCCCDQQC